MSSIRENRRRFQIAASILAGICLLAAAATFYFSSRSGQAQQEEFDSIRSQVQNRMKVVIPPAAVQGRVEEARAQIDDFYKTRLASEPSAVYAELGRLASADRVRIGGAKYELSETELPNVQMMSIEATLSGSYVDTIKFINALERSKMFFIVNGIGLNEQQGGGVNLSVKLEAYVRGQA
jgi:type IV pilus assembly protein PilO